MTTTEAVIADFSKADDKEMMPGMGGGMGGMGGMY
jgi:chaperonin GroEL